MEWDQEACIMLISEYKAKKLLWCPRDPAYYNKQKKDDAWKDLSEKIGKSGEELKKKIDSLKGSYRREKMRVKKSMRSSCKGRNKIYEPKWFAYKDLQFLEDKDEHRRSLSNLSDDERDIETSDESLDEDKDPENTRIVEEATNPEIEYTNQQSSNEISRVYRESRKKRSSKRRKFNDDSRNEESTRATSPRRNDQCGFFGEYIAAKLRTFDDRLRTVAQHRVSNVFYELEMNLYQNFDADATTQYPLFDQTIFTENPAQLPSQNGTSVPAANENETQPNDRPSPSSTPLSHSRSRRSSSRENDSPPNKSSKDLSDTTNDSEHT